MAHFQTDSGGKTPPGLCDCSSGCLSVLLVETSLTSYCYKCWGAGMDFANWDIGPWITPDNFMLLFKDTEAYTDHMMPMAVGRGVLRDGQVLQIGFFFEWLSSAPLELISMELWYHTLKATLSVPVKRAFWDALAAKAYAADKYTWAKQLKEKNTYATEGTPSGMTIKRDLASVIPGLAEATAKCPVRGCLNYSGPVEVIVLVQHLNDETHRWSREAIADWLETLDADLSFA